MGRLISKPTTDGKTPLDDWAGLRVDIRTRDELNVLEFANINKATVKYLTRCPSKKKAPFTYEWFLKIHREMFGDVWEWAGQLRQTDLNIGIDKLKIPEALKSLERDYEHWSVTAMPSSEIAARLHHRLVLIHPFKNGNGRWARLITNVYLKQKKLLLIEWPDQALLAQTDIRQRYLAALRQADQRNLQPLMQLHGELQTR